MNLDESANKPTELDELSGVHHLTTADSIQGILIDGFWCRFCAFGSHDNLTSHARTEFV